MKIDVKCARCGSGEIMGYAILISNGGEPLVDNMNTMGCGEAHLLCAKCYQHIEDSLDWIKKKEKVI